ncbi:phage-like protein [Mycobacteroides abscessus subsp. massiliense]|uniref:head decoration protein n=1 Tax=Mycobacteroides abscessus TaxID=36809 RepID=UPI0009A59F89|nr:head decoration protein [Mycobacteroides abscessus]SKU70554.1 phage-like protein [Mycobacteroides abscessus subsp. massiliense]SKU76355.1 phage-like protein [Mycobacteroides abscessus subsp. massiliense]
MSTDISVHSSSYQVEDRSWLVGTHGVDITPGITLDISKFTKSTHFPNGYIPSGTALGKVTATGLYGPYSDAASDGTQTCVGLLFSSVRAIDPVGNNLAKVGGARFIHGAVNAAKLPANSGIDVNGKADLPLIVWL